MSPIVIINMKKRKKKTKTKKNFFFLKQFRKNYGNESCAKKYLFEIFDCFNRYKNSKSKMAEKGKTV